jgi:hypothetical protein
MELTHARVDERGDEGGEVGLAARVACVADGGEIRELTTSRPRECESFDRRREVSQAEELSNDAHLHACIGHQRQSVTIMGHHRAVRRPSEGHQRAIRGPSEGSHLVLDRRIEAGYIEDHLRWSSRERHAIEHSEARNGWLLGPLMREVIRDQWRCIERVLRGHSEGTQRAIRGSSEGTPP